MIHIFSEERQEQIGLALLVLLILLSLYVFVSSFTSWKLAQSTPSSAYPPLTITVDGEGKAFSVPDTGRFTYGITVKAKTVSEAQKVLADKSKTVMEQLKLLGVEEKNIKTIAYNVYPRYEYHEQKQLRGMPPVDGQQTLVGYEAVQTTEVKIKDTTKGAELLETVGKSGATDVSNLTFTQEDENAVKDEARKKAIEDAGRKAHILAQQLGVTIVRTTGYGEYGQDGMPSPMYAEMRVASDNKSEAIMAPGTQLPVGENEIISRVSITYEIR